MLHFFQRVESIHKTQGGGGGGGVLFFLIISNSLFVVLLYRNGGLIFKKEFKGISKHSYKMYTMHIYFSL